MSLNVGDLVYISGFTPNIIYDKDKPSYPIKEIKKEQVIKQIGYGTGNVGQFEEKTYLVDVSGEIQSFDEVKAVPKVQINGIDIEEFKIDGKTIKKIEDDQGNWSFVEGQGYKPEFEGRHKFTLDDGTVVYKNKEEMENFKISPVTSGGKRSKSRTRKNKSKKVRKSRRKTNRRR